MTSLEVRPSLRHFFPTDITFVAAITFPNERFQTELFNRGSTTFQELAEKIKNNVSFAFNCCYRERFCIFVLLNISKQ